MSQVQMTWTAPPLNSSPQSSNSRVAGLRPRRSARAMPVMWSCKVGNITTQGGTEISSSSLGTTTTGAAGSISIEGDGGFPVPGAIELTSTEVSTISEGFGESGSISLAAFEGITLTDTNISGDVNNAGSIRRHRRRFN